MTLATRYKPSLRGPSSWHEPAKNELTRPTQTNDGFDACPTSEGGVFMERGGVSSRRASSSVNQPARTLTLKHAARISDEVGKLGGNASMRFLRANWASKA